MQELPDVISGWHFFCFTNWIVPLKTRNKVLTCAFLFHIVWLTQLLIVNWACLTHWLVELFTKNAFLDILENFSLEMGQISSHLLKKGFAIWQHDVLSTSSTFYDSFARASAEIKILGKWSMSLGFSFFSCFSRDWVSTGLASSSKISEKASLRWANFYHREAKWSRNKFCCTFFTPISESISYAPLSLI